MVKTKKSLELKVYSNKRNGQGVVMLPKKKFKTMPKKVKITWKEVKKI